MDPEYFARLMKVFSIIDRVFSRTFDDYTPLCGCRRARVDDVISAITQHIGRESPTGHESARAMAIRGSANGKVVAKYAPYGVSRAPMLRSLSIP